MAVAELVRLIVLPVSRRCGRTQRGRRAHNVFDISFLIRAAVLLSVPDGSADNARHHLVDGQQPHGFYLRAIRDRTCGALARRTRKADQALRLHVERPLCSDGIAGALCRCSDLSIRIRAWHPDLGRSTDHGCARQRPDCCSDRWLGLRSWCARYQQPPGRKVPGSTFVVGAFIVLMPGFARAASAPDNQNWRATKRRRRHWRRTGQTRLLLRAKKRPRRSAISERSMPPPSPWSRALSPRSGPGDASRRFLRCLRRPVVDIQARVFRGRDDTNLTPGERARRFWREPSRPPTSRPCR